MGAVIAAVLSIPPAQTSADEHPPVQTSADECPPAPLPGGVRELIIDGSQVSYTIGVHPDIVTFIYMPDKLKRIFSSTRQDHFTLEVMGPRLIMRPLEPLRVKQAAGGYSPSGVVGNIHIETESLKFTLLLRVVSDPAHATTFASFKHKSETAAAAAKAMEERIAERVREELAAERAELAAERLELARLRQTLQHNRDALVRGQAARGILARRGTLQFDYRERNDNNIILWLKSGVWVGGDLYLLFDLQNRSSEMFAFSSVQVHQSYRAGGQVVRELIDTQLVMDGIPRQTNAGVEQSLFVEPGVGNSAGLGGAMGLTATHVAPQPQGSRRLLRPANLARAATWMGDAWTGDSWLAVAIGFAVHVAPAPFTVEPGTRRQGVLCIPNAEFLRDDQLAVIVEAVEHEQSIDLQGISWR